MNTKKEIIKEKKNSKAKKKKWPLGLKVGLGIFIVGFLIILISFAINYTTNYNPYKEPQTYSPRTIADTFVVPEGAKYNRSYHIFNYKEGDATFTYSKKMFEKHALKDIDFKVEGGYVLQLYDKTYFIAYFYNLSEEEILNKNIDIEFIHYNKTTADKVTYKIENLVPLECKSIEIEVDKKVINAYDYKISVS